MKRAGAFAMISLAAALAGIAFACGSNPISIATVLSIRCEFSDAGDGGTSCPAGQFCSRTPSCGSVAGSCEIIRSADCATSGPECGCDGITYYNSCVRQAAKVSRAGAGECAFQPGQTPRQCGPNDPCPDPTDYCALVLPFTAPPPPPQSLLLDADLSPLLDELCNGQKGGVCWALPDEASCTGPASRRVEGCDLKCIDECSAIRRGGVYSGCPVTDASTD
jgi:hypothetical protein